MGFYMNKNMSFSYNLVTYLANYVEITISTQLLHQLYLSNQLNTLM